GDSLGLEEATGREHVGVDDVEGMRLDRFAKPFEEVEVLAGGDRREQRIGDPLVAGDVGPWHDVLDPGKIVRLERPAEADRFVRRGFPPGTALSTHQFEYLLYRKIIIRESKAIIRWYNSGGLSASLGAGRSSEAPRYFSREPHGRPL